MNISRNEVPEFQFATTLTTSKLPLVTVLGTVNGTDETQIRITDIKISNSGAATLIKVYGNSMAKGIKLDIASVSNVDYSWQIPYKLYTIASTAEERGIYASTNGTGVKVAISGYIEK